MTNDEIHTLYIPACQNVMSPIESWVSMKNAEDFDKLLSINEYELWVNKIRNPLPDELRNLLIGLAGPYHVAILKAYKIRKGLK